MIFSELYGAYYRAVAQILRAACAHPVGREEMRAIVDRYAFGESVLNIEPALAEERWQLLRADGLRRLQRLPHFRDHRICRGAEGRFCRKIRSSRRLPSRTW